MGKGRHAWSPQKVHFSDRFFQNLTRNTVNQRCTKVRKHCACAVKWASLRRHSFRSGQTLSPAGFFHCIQLSPHSASLVISHRVFSAFVASSHLISSCLISCLLSFAYPFSAYHDCSHLFSYHLTLLFSALLSFSILRRFYAACLNAVLLSSQLFTALLMSGRLNSTHPISHLISSQLLSTLLRCLSFSQLFSALRLFSALLSSSQLLSAHLMSFHRFSPLLTSSKLFSALLTSSHLSSPQLLSAFLVQNLLQKTDLGAKAEKVQVWRLFEGKLKGNDRHQKREK